MNKFFTLHSVASGVWAAIVIPGSGALGNAAVVDLGDITVVVDTFCLPEAAGILRESALELTGKPVKYIVNTHFHGDHHYGNQMFADSLIITTDLTREILTKEGAPEVEVWQEGLQKQIEGLTKGMHAAQDLRLQSAFAYEIADKAALLAAVPGIRRRTAALTFSDKLMIHGTARSLTLLTFGGGHTDSDAFVYIEDAKVLIAGDLVLSKSHPAMLSGFPAAWIEILQRIGQELDFSLVIPGHGEVTDHSSIGEMISYLTEIQIYAEQAAASGESADFWMARGIPIPFAEWQMSHVFEWNFRWLYKQFVNEKRGEGND
ncbi:MULTISPECIES: MBL fold metallo-hydrolase [Paenibacillus]|uniref:MBL fold metallo-hydrolase n=1 Tax=Paenibacillus tianjinensis TaxID=2810347 RepID=A0ABX7L502_9BACL|nr:MULTISPECIES: MBL fold metallo-hydrolase [Paenibacillus]QSF43062.1 MBL fold metallo-hydrolase [Paenibacillus tianjinensis]